MLCSIELLAEAGDKITHLFVLLLDVLGAKVRRLHQVLDHRPDARFKLEPVQLLLGSLLVVTRRLGAPILPRPVAPFLAISITVGVIVRMLRSLGLGCGLIAAAIHVF